MPRSRLCIADIPDDEVARHHLRFTRQQLTQLLPLLRLPPTIITPTNRYTATAEEALLIVLFRLAFPSRWNDLVFKEWFERSAPELSELFNTTCKRIWDIWHTRIRCWREAFTPIAARALAERAAAKMGYDGALFMMFFDGTDIYVQRPGGPNANQQSLFSGHHR